MKDNAKRWYAVRVHREQNAPPYQYDHQSTRIYGTLTEVRDKLRKMRYIIEDCRPSRWQSTGIAK